MAKWNTCQGKGARKIN